MHSIDNPYLEWLGVRLSDWSADYAEMTLAVAPHLANRTGRVQGGVICTLLDGVAGYAGLHHLPDQPAPQSVTLSLTTHFLASAEGRVLTAKGYTERQGRGIYFSRAEVWLDSSILLATAMGAFKYLR